MAPCLSGITASWLLCSDGDFCFDRTPESDVTAVSAACRYGCRAAGVLRWVSVFSQPGEVHSHNFKGYREMISVSKFKETFQKSPFGKALC